MEEKPEEAAPVEGIAGEDEAARPSTERWARVRHEAAVLAKDIGIAGGICVLVLLYIVQPFTVEGTSMLPTLENGQRIIVNKFLYRVREIRRGDIVVFYYPLDPSKSFIKRVIGLPGDTIEISDGFVYVNGEKLQEPYILRKYREHEEVPPARVQLGHYWVMGDHRNGSNDSRAGWQVPSRYIYGQAFFRYWPLVDMGKLN